MNHVRTVYPILPNLPKQFDDEINHKQIKQSILKWNLNDKR